MDGGLAAQLALVNITIDTIMRRRMLFLKPLVALTVDHANMLPIGQGSSQLASSPTSNRKHLNHTSLINGLSAHPSCKIHILSSFSSRLCSAYSNSYTLLTRSNSSSPPNPHKRCTRTIYSDR
jgi:hypothetical protein